MEKRFGKKFLRPTILDEIHKIFQKYPYDGGILKEMIQNAEDAGAKNVSFIFDCRTFDKKSSYETNEQASLQQLRSIVSFNDARVTAEDWKGIQSVGLSNKDKKAYKVGRFGLGMKSLFHLTDCIQIISGEDVLYLDPSCKYFKDEIHHYDLSEMLSKCPEKKRELEEASKLVADYDTRYNEDYPFTMFRLPLRNQPSDVSDRVLSDSDIIELFDQFIEDGSNNLLFLKYLQSIRLYRLSDSGSALLCSIEITLTENIQRQRLIYRESLENSKPFQICYDSCFIIQNGTTRKVERYLVVVQQNFDNSDIKTLSNKLHYQPCVGLAVPLDHSLLGEGSLFTFLPCSTNIAYPIHIHGYFALNDSRSGLKFSKIMNDDDSKWNILMLKHLLPKVYNQLFTSLSEYKSVDKIIEFFPPSSSNDPLWLISSNEIISNLLSCKFISGSLKKTTPINTKFIIDDEYAQFKIEILKASNENFVVLNKETLQTLRTFFKGHFVCEVQIKEVILQLQARNCWKNFISAKTKIGILEYLLDLNLDVSNLELLPVKDSKSNVSFSTFKRHIFYNYIYYPSNNLDVILNGVGIDFIAANSLTEKCKRLIEDMALKQNYQLRNMDISKFLSYVEHMEEEFQDHSWLELFINYILKERLSIVTGKFDNLPVIRLTTNGKDFKSYAVKNLPAIFDEAIERRVDKNILQAFGIILVKSVSKISIPFLNIRKSNNNPIIFNNVCERLFQNLFSSDFVNTGQHLSNLFGKMNNPKASDVLNYLSSNVKSIQALSAKIQVQWEGLKIFPQYERDIYVSSTLTNQFIECVPFPTKVDLIKKCDEVETLKHVFGLEEISIPMLLFLKVIPSIPDKYNTKEIVEIIQYAFQNYQANAVKKYIINRRIFPAANFTCKLLDELYSFDVSFPCKLREEATLSNYFLHPNLREFEEILSEIGLKSTLSEELLIKLFQYVVRNNDFALSKSLQNYIIKKNISINSELKWISDIEIHPENYPNGINWFGGKKCLYDRHSVFSDNHSLLVGGVKPVIPDKLYHLLNCDSTLSFDIVNKQFQVLQLQIRQLRGKNMEKAENIIKILYKQINASNDWVSEFKDQQCAWTGKEFVHPTKFIINNGNIQLEPYRFYIPNNFVEFKEFYLKCDAKEDLDCINVLIDISKNPPSSCKNGIRICSDILNSIQDTNSYELKDIMIPVETTDSCTFSMKPLSRCTQAAISNFTGVDDDCYIIEFDENRFSYILHNQLRLSEDTKNILDIRSMNESLLEFEDWTQSEDLCRRLKQLISEYKDGIGPIKELIQNADDARATTVKIMFDERSSSIKDESKYFIGPSVWVYNDGLFSESDFDAVKSINSGHKELKKSTIGKFGIGFNSVYHYTETPSFISGNNYVRFDPHAQYSGSLSKKQRGGYRIKLDESKLKPLKRLLSPFEGIFGCKVPSQCRFDGTLFRLQLRSREQAFQSLISKISYDSENIEELIQIVLNFSSDLLLFTQCICEFQMFHINASGGIKEIINMKKTLGNALNTKALQIEKIPKCLREKTNYIEVIQHANVLLDNYDSQTVVLINIDKKVGSAFKYLNKGEGDESYQWIIGQNKITNVLPELEERGSVAIGGVAICLSENVSYDNSLYCFLPLPISTDLPFHLNGSFATSHDRRNIIRNTKGDRHVIEHEWNKLLFERVIPLALKDTFSAIKTIIINGESCRWYELFPTLNVYTDHFIEKLIRIFYREMIKSSDGWFIFQMNWYEPNDIRFLSEELYKLEELTNIDLDTIAFDLFELPFPKLPMSLRNTIEKCEEEYFMNRVIDTKTFYSSLVENSDSINSKHFDLIIKSGLEQFPSTISDILERSKCIRTKPNGILKLPKEVVLENSELSPLFDFEENRFCDWDKEDVESVKTELSAIGIISTKLSVEQIIERCKVFEENRKDPDFINRGHLICSVIHKTHSSGTIITNEQLNKLKNISFIPIKVKSEKWELDWHDDGCTYLYSSKAIRKCDFRLIAFVKPALSNQVPLRLPQLLNIEEASVEEVLENVNILQNCKISEQVKTIYNEIITFLSKKDFNSQDFPLLVHHNNGFKFEKDHSKCYRTGIFTNLEPFMFECVRNSNAIKFLNILHVKQEPSFNDFIQILSEIKKKSDESCTSICDDEVNMIISILNGLIADKTNLKNFLMNNDNHIFVPSTNNVLLSHRDLCFCNIDWIDKSELQVCHEKISINLAKKLEIPSNQDKFFSSKSIGIGEEFGQSEDLLSRIRTLLRAYPNDGTIIREIIQNADDAGATEIQFILDANKYGDEKIFGDSWKPLQKCPALLVYNNGKFRKEDFDGIQRLGEGSKKDDVTKVGEFGVGFNCVYHLTDVPIIVANHEERGPVFCVFDPHRSYFPKAENFLKPGRMISLKDMNSYSDVLQTLPQEFDLENGVLFRFPLRDNKMANRSKLSDRPLRFKEAEKILEDHFHKTVKESLFFLNNIQKIVFKKKIGDSYENISCISTSREPFSKKSQQTNFTQEVYNNDRFDPLSLCYYLKISDSKKYEKWLIYRSFGFREIDNLPSDLSNEKFNPEAGVALPIKLETSEGIKKKIFCHLPLPIESHMPVHINGRFYLDHENRRAIRKNEDSDNAIEVRWNLYVFNKLIGYCYARIIEKLKILVTEKELTFNNFYSFFPKLHKEDTFIKGVCEGCMSYLKKSKIFAFESSNSAIEWLSYNEHNKNYLLYFQFDRKSVVNILKDIGMKITEVPTTLKEEFAAGHMDIYEVNETEVVKFLLSKYHCFGKLPLHITETPFMKVQRLESVIKFIDTEFESKHNNQKKCDSKNDDLERLPLFLNEEDELDVFDPYNLIIATEYTLLFQNMKENVVNKKIIKTSLIYKLKKTGVVREATTDLLAQYIVDNIPEELDKSKQIVEYHEKYEEYIANFWKWAKDQHKGSLVAITAILQQFSNYSLLPCKSSDKIYIIPLKYHKAICSENNDMITKLNIFQRDNNKVEFNQYIPDLIYTKNDNISDFILCLTLYDGDILPKLNYQNLEKEELRKIFRWVLEIEKDADNTKLLHLPVFETIGGKYTSLFEKHIYTLKTCAYLDFTNENSWKPNDIHILDYKVYKTSNIWNNLLKYKAKLVSPLFFFEKYILKKFPDLEIEEQIKHLRNLSTCLKLEQEINEAKYYTESLKSIEFVQCLDEKYRKPSDTFSMNMSKLADKFDFKRIPIYKKILSETDSHYYNSLNCLEELLIDLGMKEIISSDICLGFCEIASKNPEQQYDVQILQFLFYSDISEWPASQLDKVINYPFIYPAKVKNEYEKLSKCTKTLISINNSYLNTKEAKYALFWTAFPMLPYIDTISIENFPKFKTLNVKTKVSITDLIEHLKNLNVILREKIENDCDKVKMIFEIYGYIFKYLSEVKESKEDVKNILRVPIPDDDNNAIIDMIKIQNLYEDKDNYNIPGYFCKRPEYLFPHQSLLYEMGLVKKVEPQILCNIMSEIYEYTNQGNVPLNEKNLHAAKSAIKYLQFIIQNRKIDQIESQLYLITRDENGKYFLKPSQELYFIDIEIHKQLEAKLINYKIIVCFDLNLSKAFFGRWNKKFLPKNISELVEETIESFNECSSNCSSVGDFWKDRLRSLLLKTALTSILCQIGVESTKEKYLKRLSNIEIKLVSNLIISLRFAAKKHKKSHSYFIDNRNEQIVIYLNVDFKNEVLKIDFREQAKQLAKYILFDLKVDEERVVHVFFDCLYTQNVNDIQKILEENGFSLQYCNEYDSLSCRILLEGEILELFFLRSEFQKNEVVVFQETTSLSRFLPKNASDEKYEAIFYVSQVIEIFSTDKDNIWNNEYIIEYQPQKHIKVKGYELFYIKTDTNKEIIDNYVKNSEKESVEKDLLLLKLFDTEVQKKCIIETFFNWLEEKHNDNYKAKCAKMKTVIHEIVKLNFTQEVIEFIEEKLEITAKERIKAHQTFQSKIELLSKNQGFNNSQY
ncbi:DgyrCDS13316 [Dimorphilus gyrociliatus]|uniref:DgyrCDS13316 n=1 Tax=Dimorphilus gyrociliatus TaxID=2664684 RepID=A0A7I8WAF2_9ANNE|nr:DgyrCDS13316 [Dimorphilus gyrociliatus]